MKNTNLNTNLKSNPAKTILGSALVACLLPFEFAVAQMQGPALEEIIVTARKREESLQDVPVVVSALDSAMIDQYRATKLSDMTEFIPGLNMDEGAAGYQTINLRGVQSSSVSPSIDQAVSVNVDGVQSSNGYALRLGQFDLEQVEVLKGPQALFFGKNSPGGIVALRTANPTAEFYSRVQAGHEFTNGRPYLDAIISGPLNETWGGRLAAHFTNSSGYVENAWPGNSDDDVSSYDEMNVRATLQYEGYNFDATFKANIYEYDGDDFHNTQAFGCTWVNEARNPTSDCKLSDQISVQQVGPSFFGRNPFIPPGTALSAISPTFADSPNSDLEAEWLTLEMNYDLNDIWSLASLTGWSTIEAVSSGNPLPGPAVFLLGQDNEIGNLSQELRFSGAFNTFTLLLGAFYDDRTIDQLGSVSVGGSLWPDTIQSIDGDSWSLFAQSDIDLSEFVTLSVGARYTEETKGFSGRNINDGAFLHPRIPPPVRLAGNLPVATDTLDEDNFSPEVSLSWHASDSVLLFAAYKEGFKSGSFNFSATSNPLFVLTPPAAVSRNEISYGPESVEGFEAGAKMMLLDRTLRLNISAFTYTYDDLQLAAYDPTTVSTRTVNAAKAGVDGAELELNWLPPIDGLTVFANLSLLDSAYDDFVSDCSEWQRWVTGAAGGCNVDVDGNPMTDTGGLLAGTGFEAQDRSGDPLRLAADVAGTFGATYFRTLDNGMFLSGAFTAVFTGDQVTDNTNDPRSVADEYWLLHAAVGLGAADESWQVDLIVRNLTDETAATRSGSLPFSSDNRSIQAMFSSRNQPRQVSLQLTLRPELF